MPAGTSAMSFRLHRQAFTSFARLSREQPESLSTGSSLRSKALRAGPAPSAKAAAAGGGPVPPGAFRSVDSGAWIKTRGNRRVASRPMMPTADAEAGAMASAAVAAQGVRGAAEGPGSPERQHQEHQGRQEHEATPSAAEHEEQQQQGVLGQQQQQQTWDPAHYQEHCSFVSSLGSPVLDLLAPLPGERILDLGCGDGTLAREIQNLGCVVKGVDFSPEMVLEAQSKGVDAEVLDGHDLPSRFSHPEFDAVFTNAALHWMKRDPAAVVNGVASCLKPGGRFVGEFGGFGNVAAIVTALLGALRIHGHHNGNSNSPTPWFYPTVDMYSTLLESHGFEVQQIELIHRPTVVPGGIRTWLTAFGGAFVQGLSDAQRETVFAEVESLLKPSLCTPSGICVADYVRLRFKANLKDR